MRITEIRSPALRSSCTVVLAMQWVVPAFKNLGRGVF
jgi:hypothetical protein